MVELYSDWTSLSPELVWGLLTRGVGLIFLISFTSLWGQVLRSAGSDCGLPLARRLEKIEEDFPAPWRFFYFPTLLWLNRSDAMLRLLCGAGWLAALAVVIGGEHSFWALLVCYVAYLSLDLPMGLIFPWDCLLFELGFLSLLLPATHPLPDMAATAAPAPAVAWAARLLVFRVMLGFGKTKFADTRKGDSAYLRGFLVQQPLPSKLGWYAQKLPLWMLKGMVGFMFVVEIIMPFMMWVPGPASVVAALGTMALMIGIQAMGSFGYFSMLTMVACIALFDNVTPTRLFEQSFSAHLVANSVVIAHTAAALLYFPFNSWMCQSWLLWPLWLRAPRWLGWPIYVLRALHPFRWAHSYGVFPPHTYPGAKGVVAIEVSWDGETWHECDFNYFVSRPESEPRFVSPHHPRGDQAVIYETYGANPTSLITSMLGPWDPYSYSPGTTGQMLVQLITQGKGPNFLDSEVLRNTSEPPKQARILTYLLFPTTLAEKRRTGTWWHRVYVGPHMPEREYDPHYAREYLPEPELWHWDAVVWRRRSKLRHLIRRARAQDPLDETVLEGAPELTREHLAAFWNDFLPEVGEEARHDWDHLADAVDRVRSRFDRPTQHVFYRIFSRYALALVTRLEPHYLGTFKPAIEAPSYFHLWMLANHVIGEGKEALQAAYAAPLSVGTKLDELTYATGTYLLGVFRFEHFVFDAQKLRLLTAVMGPYDGRPMPEESDDKAEVRTAQLAKAMSGYFHLMPHLRRHFQGPRHHKGHPERLPKFTTRSTGEIVPAPDWQPEDHRTVRQPAE